MKALIAPLELLNHEWISGWTVDGVKYTPITERINEFMRVAQVEEDGAIFDVAEPLVWVTCPDDCSTDSYGYKDNVFIALPKNVTMPEATVEVMAATPTEESA